MSNIIACDLITKLTNKYQRMAKANKDIQRQLAGEQPTAITSYLKSEISIFEDDLELCLQELKNIYQSMENGLRKRQEIMIKHKVEDQYQNNKQNKSI